MCQKRNVCCLIEGETAVADSNTVKRQQSFNLVKGLPSRRLPKYALEAT